MQLTFPKLAVVLAHLSIASGKTLRTTGGGATDNIVSERDLESLPCNVVYQTLTSATIQASLNEVFLQRPGNVTEDSTIVEEMIPLIEFDVQFMKVSSRRLPTCTKTWGK